MFPTTSGWPSYPRSVPVDMDQAIRSLEAFVLLICFRELWRMAL
jgi:hypothetical protein